MRRRWKKWSKMKDPRRERKIRRRINIKNNPVNPKLFKGTNQKQVCSTKKNKNQNQLNHRKNLQISKKTQAATKKLKQIFIKK